METEYEERLIEEEARGTATLRIASGKAHIPSEQRNEQAEKRISEEIKERARAGDHFPSSLPVKD